LTITNDSFFDRYVSIFVWAWDVTDWNRLPEFIRADRDLDLAEQRLRRARTRWVRMRRSGSSPEQADLQSGVELAAIRARLARRRVRAMAGGHFDRMTALQAVWAAPDFL
jgi:hypothetical protein